MSYPQQVIHNTPKPQAFVHNLRSACTRSRRSAYGLPMKRHKEVEALILEAESQRRCAFGAKKSVRSAMGRRAAALELKRVFPNMYATPEYWNALDPPEQTLHIARTLGVKHPDWVFSGIVAAAAYGFEHQWSLHTGTISIVSHTQSTESQGHRVQRLYASRYSVETASGLTLVDRGRTVVDCCRLFPFRYALPIVDSALGQGVKVGDILSVCDNLQRDCSSVFRALHYADANSENGGESLMRGTIIDCGFMPPRTQETFVDPQTGKVYRADFVWHIDGSDIIVAEFDGMGKYVDPSMTNRRSVQSVVLAEREREQALHRAGVTAIVRFTFDEVVQRSPVLDRLRAAGVPLHDGVI